MADAAKPAPDGAADGGRRRTAAMAREDVSDAESTSGLTREIAAEAAVWIARLHGPSRSARMERDCLAWQARSAAHRLAFERCTEVWQAVPQLSLADAYASGQSASSSDQGVARSRGKAWSRVGPMLVALVTVAALAALTAGAGLYLARSDPDYVTAVGEQRSVVLVDGSLLSLNTDTRVDVDMTPALRSVRVERGEAMFEVTKDASRPFVVQVSGSEVVALGTAFAVRLTDTGPQDRAQVAVTLIEGRVSVRPASGARESHAVAPPKELQLRPGERVKLVESRTGSFPVHRGGPFGAADRSRGAASAVVTLDHPRIDQVTAWKRSEVVFDDVALPEAVGEMNRYSRVPIVLAADAALARLRVTGSYRAGDSDGFARAAATLHGLVMRRQEGRLELLRRQ